MVVNNVFVFLFLFTNILSYCCCMEWEVQFFLGTGCELKSQTSVVKGSTQSCHHYKSPVAGTDDLYFQVFCTADAMQASLNTYLEPSQTLGSSCSVVKTVSPLNNTGTCFQDSTPGSEIFYNIACKYGDCFDTPIYGQEPSSGKCYNVDKYYADECGFFYQEVDSNWCTWSGSRVCCGDDNSGCCEPNPLVFSVVIIGSVAFIILVIIFLLKYYAPGYLEECCENFCRSSYKDNDYNNNNYYNNSRNDFDDFNGFGDGRGNYMNHNNNDQNNYNRDSYSSYSSSSYGITNVNTANLRTLKSHRERDNNDNRYNSGYEMSRGMSNMNMNRGMSGKGVDKKMEVGDIESSRGFTEIDDDDNVSSEEEESEDEESEDDDDDLVTESTGVLHEDVVLANNYMKNGIEARNRGEAAVASKFFKHSFKLRSTALGKHHNDTIKAYQLYQLAKTSVDTSYNMAATVSNSELLKKSKSTEVNTKEKNRDQGKDKDIKRDIKNKSKTPNKKSPSAKDKGREKDKEKDLKKNSSKRRR